MSVKTRFSKENALEEDTKALAVALAPLLQPGDLLILSGGLGAGKTFFTRALCYALGLAEDERVTSPTYTLVHEIPTAPPIVHADLYRLQSPEEVYDLGLDDQRQNGSLLVVEWGAPFVQALGGDAIYLHFEIEPRKAEVFGEGRRAREVVLALNSAGGASL